MATNPAPLFQSGLCLFVPLLSVSTVLCSSANEFICTSPFLNQHINPDHWSHPHGKNGPSPSMESRIGLTFPPRPPSRPLALSLGPSAFQHSASAYSTSCPSRHDTLSTARGGLKNSPPGCPDCMPPYRSLHSGMKLWKCMDDFYVEERGNEIESH